MNQQNMKQFEKEWNKIWKSEKKMTTKKHKIMGEILKEMSEKNSKIAELDIENRVMKIKMAKMEAELKSRNITIRNRKLPAELLNELFASLPLENAFRLLAKVSNGLLARNVQKMLESIKMEMKENKWNAQDSGPMLAISGDGHYVEYSGPNNGLNCVRSKFPILPFKLAINKHIIIFYFEVAIQQKQRYVSIGFCCQKFPLINKWLGKENSIGITHKEGINFGNACVDFREDENEDPEEFTEGDIVGIGIIYSNENASMECFSTCNGELLGKAELPARFATLQLFPAINLARRDDSIRANFGNEEWLFKEFNEILKDDCDTEKDEDEEEEDGD